MFLSFHPGRRALVCALAFLVVAVSPAARAVTELAGQAPSGALYHIVVPDGWQPADGLVIWNHGYNGAPLEEALWLGSLADWQLADGYAVAASSYRDTEWAVFYAVDDVRDLIEMFESEFGVPEKIFLSGLSMGGLITARVIEQGGFDNVVGALTWCGAMGPTSRTWDLFLDVRLLYDVICGAVPGAAIPGGAWGLPYPPDPNFEPDWEDFFNPVAEESNPLLLALDTCTGLATPADDRSPEQQSRLDHLLTLAGIEAEFLGPDMFLGTLGIRDLIHDPEKLGGVMPFDNLEVDYGDPEINAAIERVGSDGDARHMLIDNYTPSGRVGDVKIVSLHTDRDGIVPVEQLKDYADIVPASNLTVGIAVENVPSHCVHTDAELVGSWEALKAWVDGAPQPSAATLQSTCEAAVAAGTAGGPCRFDPDFVIGELDDRLPPRSVCTSDGTTLCLEDGRFRVTVAWQDFAGNTGQGRAAPQTDHAGSFWFFDSDNIELTVKALDGRQINGHFWVFYGSLTSVDFELTVTDTVTGQEHVYENARGRFDSAADLSTF